MSLEPPPPPVPEHPSYAALKRAVQDCRACDLWEGATQPVLGEGSTKAEVMLVGEQPGDREDIAVPCRAWPLARVSAWVLERAGIPRDDAYITNVVKHFRYKARGKRRIHQKPDRWQITACLPWLRAELELVKPVVLVCLGATAAQALLGSQVRIGRDRGCPMESGLAE